MRSFLSVPVRPVTGAPFYELLVDTEEFRDRDSIDYFMGRFDEKLCEMNRMYRQKLNELYLGAPRMALVVLWNMVEVKTCGYG